MRSVLRQKTASDVRMNAGLFKNVLFFLSGGNVPLLNRWSGNILEFLQLFLDTLSGVDAFLVGCPIATVQLVRNMGGVPVGGQKQELWEMVKSS